MSDYALHTVFVSPEQAKTVIAQQIAPYCKRLWSDGVERVAALQMPVTRPPAYARSTTSGFAGMGT